MLDEFKKSIQSVLYERISSPFSGAFILSWLVWNWKLIYYIITVESKIPFDTRVQFIQSNYIAWEVTLFYPVLSAAFFVILYPFITTGAMYVWLRHKKWQNEIRNKIENMQLLSLEKSIALRMEMKNQSERFESLISKKEDELKLLQNNYNILQSKYDQDMSQENVIIENDGPKYLTIPEEQDKDLTFIMNHYLVRDNIAKLIEAIYENKPLKTQIGIEAVTFFEINDIIKYNDTNSRFNFTEKGKKLLKEYYKNEDGKVHNIIGKFLMEKK